MQRILITASRLAVAAATLMSPPFTVCFWVCYGCCGISPACILITDRRRQGGTPAPRPWGNDVTSRREFGKEYAYMSCKKERNTYE